MQGSNGWLWKLEGLACFSVERDWTTWKEGTLGWMSKVRSKRTKDHSVCLGVLTQKKSSWWDHQMQSTNLFERRSDGRWLQCSCTSGIESNNQDFHQCVVEERLDHDVRRLDQCLSTSKSQRSHSSCTRQEVFETNMEEMDAWNWEGLCMGQSLHLWTGMIISQKRHSSQDSNNTHTIHAHHTNQAWWWHHTWTKREWLHHAKTTLRNLLRNSEMWDLIWKQKETSRNALELLLTRKQMELNKCIRKVQSRRSLKPPRWLQAIQITLQQCKQPWVLIPKEMNGKMKTGIARVLWECCHMSQTTQDRTQRLQSVEWPDSQLSQRCHMLEPSSQSCNFQKEQLTRDLCLQWTTIAI